MDRASNSLRMFIYTQRPSSMIPMEKQDNRISEPGLHEVISQLPQYSLYDLECQFPELQIQILVVDNLEGCSTCDTLNNRT